MEIEKKIDELQDLVSKYDIESFAGFFAYFIRKRPDAFADIDLNKFDSKLKDFLYLIALNCFSVKRGSKKIEHSTIELGALADMLNEIKRFNSVKDLNYYKRESVIHEMAFRNHFDNGVLSYVEQDIERLRTVFAPFDNKIIEDFGFDIDFLIEMYKEIELILMIRFKYVMEFSYTKEFVEFNRRVFSKEMEFPESFDLLPENIQQAFLAFQSKTYAYLMFTREDFYHRFAKEKVNKFLELFSCEPTTDNTIRYYSAQNPFELTPILKLSENSYLNLYSKQIPIAIYNKLYARFFKDENYNVKLRKHRELSLEKKVVEIFRSFFPTRETFFYENYSVEKNYEQDLLIIHKGSVLIIETKASKLREPLRDVDKAIKRLEADFKDSIQYGFEQCKRVEDYFFDKSLFDIKDKKGRFLYKVNPNRIHNIYSIVVTLERFGSLQTDLSLMLNKENDVDYPWSVYVDDLEIFLLALKYHNNNPTARFLDFLKLRREIHGHIYSIDELDICATYIESPKKFKRYSDNKEDFLTFSPYKQGDFDKLYFAGLLRFKEKSLPDNFYKFGI